MDFQKHVLTAKFVRICACLPKVTLTLTLTVCHQKFTVICFVSGDAMFHTHIMQVISLPYTP